MMVKQCIEKYFKINAGGAWCGVFVREKAAKKLAKLLYRQSQEIKEFLAGNLNDIEVADWTLAYPNGIQKSVEYFIESSDSEKLERIDLFDKAKILAFCENGVFSTDEKSRLNASIAVEEKFMEIYND